MILLLSLISCEEQKHNEPKYVEYLLGQEEYIPDKDKMQCEECIHKLVMEASRYSDAPGALYVMNDANIYCKSLYTKTKIDFIRKTYGDGITTLHISISELIGHDLVMYKRLVQENVPMLKENLK